MRDSALQFELKKVFVLVTAAAIICVLIAPFIRDWEPERYAYALRLLLFVAAGTGLMAVPMLYVRYRAETRSGPRLLLLWLPAGRLRSLPWIMLFIVGITIMTLLFFPPVGVAAKRVGNVTSTNYFTGFCMGTILGQGILQAWWQRMLAVELCENGVITGGLHFFTWTSLRYVRWNPEKRKLNLGTARSPIIITVPAEQRDAVSQIVAQKRPECASVLPT